MKKIPFLRLLTGVGLLTLLFNTATAENNVKHFDKYSMYYTVFNSTFIQPNVAKAYGLKRSKYESLINISVVKSGEYGGLPVTISGTVKDLMQQQKPLNFREFKEDGAVYYLAPIRIAGEDIVHFEISVQPKGEKAPLVAKFTQKIYADK